MENRTAVAVRRAGWSRPGSRRRVSSSRGSGPGLVGIPRRQIPAQHRGAWTSPSGATEEDEAEFVDAMADA